MKKHLLFLGIVALCLSACGPTYVVQQAPPPAPVPPPPPPAPEDVSYQTFYDQLSPYGQWIEDPQYGYVWMPNVGTDFKPYSSNGNWVYTDEGWAWNSNYPWGWAAFHYGRWFFKDGYGWMWIPGNEWAPAWVSWRNSNEYYGWAPLGPSVTMTIAIGGGYNPPPHYWCFVPHQYVASPQVSNYYVHESNNVTIINRTTVINNTTVNNTTINNTTINNTTVNNNRPRGGFGPDPNEVGRYTGAPVRPVVIQETRTPGTQSASGSFAVYRPRVNSAPAADAHPGNNGRPAFAPAHVQTIDNVRPVNRTSYGNPGQPGGGNAQAGYMNNSNNGNNGNNASNGNNGNNGNGNNGNHNGWNNRPEPGNGNNGNGNSGAPSNIQAPANPAPNTTPANPANTQGRPVTFPGAPSGQVNNPGNGHPGRGFQQGQPAVQNNAQQAAQQATQNSAQQAAQPAVRNNRQQPAPPATQSTAQQPSTPANTQVGRRNAPTGNTNQPKPVAGGAKPAPPQQHPPHPPAKPDNKPENKP